MVVEDGPRGNTEQSRITKLMPKLMRLGRAGGRSDRAMTETERQLDKITPGIEMFQASDDDATAPAPPDSIIALVSTSGNGSGIEFATESTTNSRHTELQNATVSVAGTATPGTANAEASTQQSPASVLHMSLTAPPVSKPKGRSSGQKQQAMSIGNPLSTYNKQNHGDKDCGTCGVRGSHYMTTCPLNPNRSRAAENRVAKRGGKVQDGPPRKRGRPCTKKKMEEANSQKPTEPTIAHQTSLRRATLRERLRNVTYFNPEEYYESD